MPEGAQGMSNEKRWECGLQGWVFVIRDTYRMPNKSHAGYNIIPWGGFMGYVVTVDNRLYTFFYDNDRIFWRQFDDGWSKSNPLSVDAAKDFSVSIAEGKVVVVSRDNKGILSKSTFDDDIVTEVLLQDFGGTGQYHIAADGMLHNLPVTNPYFRLVPVTDKHFLVVYQSRDGLGYREVYGRDVGGFNVIHNHPGQYADYSFFATKYAIYGAFVVRGLFGWRLIYKTKTDGGGFRETLVTETSKPLYNVLLYILDGMLRLVFASEDNLYETRLEDGGFSPITKLNGIGGKNMVKAVFLTNNTDNRFLTNELLVDKISPWEIYLHKNFIVGSFEKNLPAIKSVKNEDDGFFNNMESEFYAKGRF